MTDRRDRALIARQFDARLRAEGLDRRKRKDRKACAATAAAEAAERRLLRGLRRRPSYVTGEVRQPFEAEVRLIRAEGRVADDVADRGDDPEHGVAEAAAPARSTFADMRVEAAVYPAVPADVRARKRIERRGRVRGRG